MKGLTKALHKAKSVLAGKRGESLMESVASILIFNLLMLAVAVMIKTSLRITEYSTSDAAARQEQANALILADSFLLTADLELQDSSGHGINVEIPVTFNSDDIFQAFIPATSGVT